MRNMLLTFLLERANIPSKSKPSIPTDCGGIREDQPNNNAICNLMHESSSSPSNISNMHVSQPKQSFGSPTNLCDVKSNHETIPPPTYNEAIAPITKISSEVTKFIHMIYFGII